MDGSREDSKVDWAVLSDNHCYILKLVDYLRTGGQTMV